MRANGPWWSKQIWQTGPLAIGFLMLLAAMLGWNPFARNHQGPTASAIEQKMDDHVRQSGDVLQILRKICRHTAKTDQSKEDCDR